MHNQRTPTHTNKDFPFFNVRGACISCGDGWLLGYWRRQPKYGYRGARAFDPLEDKLMCDACRHDHPLGPYYFPDYYSYVTDDAIQRVQAEADGACPADAAKQLYKSQLQPAYDSSSAKEQQEIPPPSAYAFDCAPLAVGSMPSSAPAHAAPHHVAEQAARSLLAGVVSSVAAHFAGPESAVLPIVDYVVARAEDIALHRHKRWRRKLHWYDDYPTGQLELGSHGGSTVLQRYFPDSATRESTFAVHEERKVESWYYRSLRMDAGPDDYS